jgi:hypothetical protein
MLMTQGAFGLGDAVFFEKKLIQKSDQILEQALDDKRFRGVLIDAPRRVDIALRDALPLLGVRKCTHEQSFDVPLAERALLVGSWLDTGEVLAGHAFQVKDPEPPIDATRPATFPKGESVEPFTIAARERLTDLAWRPGALALVVLLFDEKSNWVTTQLESSAAKDPARPGSADPHHLTRYPLPVSPPEANDVSYHPHPSSPALPDAVGIRLAIEPSVERRHGAKAVLRGSFRLPITPADTVRPRPDDPELATRWHDVHDPKATAVLPLTLVITGNDVSGPWVKPMQIPVQSRLVRAGPQEVGTGFFSVDLLDGPEGLGLHQTYVIWAVHRGVISEPSKTSLVPPRTRPSP